MSYFSKNFLIRKNFLISYFSEGNLGVKPTNTYVSFPDFYRCVAYKNLGLLSDQDFDYEKVTVIDGERPEQLSNRLYESTDYYWTFFIINSHLRLGEAYQWSLSQKQLINLVDSSKYKNVVTILNPTHLDDLNLSLREFIIGEEVIGETSGNRAFILKIRPDHGQILLSNVRPYNFERTEQFLVDSKLVFDAPEVLIGQESGERIRIDKSQLFPYAVYKYIDRDSGREVSNPNFIPIGDELSSYVGEITHVSFLQHFEEMNKRLSSIKVLKKEHVLRFANKVQELLRTKSDVIEDRIR